jgi:molybdopterin-guanine dinucleotide biosynthesis protein A
MGTNKALLPLHGRPLAQHVAEIVSAAAGSAVLVGGPDVGFPVIPDLYPGEGPLGGILTALKHSQSPWNLIVACDMPELDATLLSGLLAYAERSQSQAVLAAGAAGRPEPLCAAYHRDALSAIETEFQAGMRRVTDGLKNVSVELYFTQKNAFFNVNTPAEWAKYAAK